MNRILSVWVSVATLVGVLSSSLASAGVVTGTFEVDVDKSAILRVPIEQAGTDFQWAVADKSLVTIEGQNRNEVYIVLLDLPRGKHVVSFVSFDQRITELVEVSAGKPGPLPPPGPQPDPDPTPTKFGLVNAVRVWVTSFVDPSSRSSAQALAGSFRGISSAIAAGTIAAPQAILTETKNANNAALGANVRAWEPFGEKLSAEIKRLYLEKKIVTPADFAEAWNEVATGLEAFR